MRNLRQQDDYWKPCRPGTILRVSESKFRRDRRKFMIRAAMGSVVVASGLAAGLFTLLHRKKHEPTAIAVGTRPQLRSRENLAANEDELNDDLAHKHLENVAAFTCRDVNDLVESYVVVMRIDEQKRTHVQSEMIERIDRHLELCGKCTKMVENAMQV